MFTKTNMGSHLIIKSQLPKLPSEECKKYETYK